MHQNSKKCNGKIRFVENRIVSPKRRVFAVSARAAALLRRLIARAFVPADRALDPLLDELRGAGVAVGWGAWSEKIGPETWRTRPCIRLTPLFGVVYQELRA